MFNVNNKDTNQNDLSKLNVYKTFKRHPGHLLNVLCNFNFLLSFWSPNFQL